MFFVQGRRLSVSFKSRFLSANYALLGVMIKNRHANYILQKYVLIYSKVFFRNTGIGKSIRCTSYFFLLCLIPQIKLQ